jgi:hypothetical protein
MTVEGETTEMQAASASDFSTKSSNSPTASFLGAFSAATPCCCSRISFEPHRVLFRLFKMLLKAGSELFIARRFDHLRQRLDDLLLGTVEIFEFLARLTFSRVVVRATIWSFTETTRKLIW